MDAESTPDLYITLFEEVEAMGRRPTPLPAVRADLRRLNTLLSQRWQKRLAGRGERPDHPGVARPPASRDEKSQADRCLCGWQS